MKHLGDITKLNGAEIPIVDVITGGSPCQDLSVAGKGAGLSGERSGLFMEQIRVVKEMREYDGRTNRRSGQHIRPRYMVWENVTGAFSSNKGRDFQTVLTEIVKIAEPNAATVPMPDKGRWPHAGCLYDEMGGWSVAWRLHDAQFWGVPQRRKRIALVADFGGLSAPEILFERKGLSGYIEESGEERQAATGDTEESAACTVYSGDNITSPTNKAIPQPGDPCHTLDSDSRNYLVQPVESYTLKIRGGCEVDSKGNKAGKGALIQTEKSGTLGVSQDQTVFCRNVAETIDANYYKGCGERQGKEREVVCVGNGQLCNMAMAPIANSLDCMHDQQAVLAFDRAAYNQGENAKYDISIQEDKAQPLVARGPGGVLTDDERDDV